MTAPYVSHPLFERAVLEAGAPTWDPSPEVIEFLGTGIESTQELQEWIAEVHRRGLCSRCGQPIEWTTTRRRTHSDACRKGRSRARARSASDRRWIAHERIRDLIGQLEEIDYPDWERRARHQRYLAILRGEYPPPKRSRLGHAGGVKRPDEDHGESDSFMTFSSPDSMRRHEGMALLDPGDAETDAWLKERGYGPDGEPL